MTRSRRKQNGRQKTLDGWTTHPTGREESALNDFIQETDFEEYLERCRIDEEDWLDEPYYWHRRARAGVYFSDVSEINLEFVSNGSHLGLGDQHSPLPAELRVNADDLQHLERLETESCEAAVRLAPTRWIRDSMSSTSGHPGFGDHKVSQSERLLTVQTYLNYVQCFPWQYPQVHLVAAFPTQDCICKQHECSYWVCVLAWVKPAPCLACLNCLAICRKHCVLF